MRKKIETRTRIWKKLAFASIILSIIFLILSLIFPLSMSAEKLRLGDFFLTWVSILFLAFSLYSYYLFSKLKNMIGYFTFAGTFIGMLIFLIMLTYFMIMTVLAKCHLAHGDWLFGWQFMIVYFAIPAMAIGALIGLITGAILFKLKQTKR